MAAMAVESWDDADFQGDFHNFAAASTGTVKTSISSRLSVHSESVAGDEDWNVVLHPDDQKSTNQAILSAKQAGIPLPNNVPSSALLGGTIRRLGRKKSRQKLNEDWDNDLVMSEEPLQLKPRTTDHSHLSSGGELDDFDDLEGSLGIRFAGSRRDARGRSSSASIMSPSLGSATADSDVDELGGLELPQNPVDFEAILKKRRAAEAELSDLSQASPAQDQPATMNTHKKSRLFTDDNDDFMNDLEFDGADVLDVRKRTTNKNVLVKSTKPQASASRPATTLNFHDKPTDKPIYNRSNIPRPVSGSKQATRLEPVLEIGARSNVRERRQPTTTSAQLLRSKRSAPALRNQHSNASLHHIHHKTSVPFLPSSPSNAQRPMPFHLRNHSGNHRAGAQSPPPRPTSRLSHQMAPDTPSRTSRQRPDLAPASLAREAAAKRLLTKPSRNRDYGNGSELEAFDDLPTSSTKESKFMKAPSARGTPKPGLRQTQSRADMRDQARRPMHLPDRMMTPAPPRTPVSPTKGFHDLHPGTPSYLRDTAASRIARESRLGNNTRPRSEGPLQPLSTNWKAQVAARSPHTSPSAQRTKGRGPALIAGIGANVARSEKGMFYNPQTLRWEGNENTLAQFDMLGGGPLETPTPSSHHPQTSYMDARRPLGGGSGSPSRPALIAQIPTGHGPNVAVQNGMVFDPVQMKWLKIKGGRDVTSGQFSPSITDGEGRDDDEDEEDAFAGIDDLPDENTPAGGLAAGLLQTGGSGAIGLASPVSIAAAGVGDVHEEFDLGPRFIQTQRDEEAAWRRKCDLWFEQGRQWVDDGRWRWAIREIVPQGVDVFAAGG